MSLFRASICRVSRPDALHWAPRPRPEWAWGDYVVGEVLDGGAPEARVELESGRMVSVVRGDLVVGAFGTRAATLEITGSYADIGEDGRFAALTGAGLFGRVASASPFSPRPITLAYRGHVHDGERKSTMAEAAGPPAAGTLSTPVCLVVGSSMSAGKTATARVIVRRLVRMGKRVVAAKLTGAARYRDVLSMGDAGAEWLFDFVDAGLPSTACPEDVYRSAISGLLARMGAVGADVAVVEAGASPLEPYNGKACVELLEPDLRFTVLCASDPYAALGIEVAFERAPDVVAGVATNTDAGRALVERLTGRSTLALLDATQHARLDAMLRAALADPQGGEAPSPP